MRRLARFLILLALAGPALAQESAPEIAGMRQELAQMKTALSALKSDLAQSSGPISLNDGALLDRMAAMELQLSRLTAKAERLEFRIEEVVADATRRIADVEFRICDMDPVCIWKGPDSTLPVGLNAQAPVPDDDGLLAGEKRAFDAAIAAVEAANFDLSITRLNDFIAAYPGGPLTVQAFLLLGQTQREMNDHQAAARSFLEGYALQPGGPKAPEALLQLGVSLHMLGRKEEGCLTLDEVRVRFNNDEMAQAAGQARAELQCPEG